MEEIGVRRYYIDDLKMNAEVYVELKNKNSPKEYFTKWTCSEDDIKDMCKEELFRFYNKEPRIHLAHTILKEMIIYCTLDRINNFSLCDIGINVYNWTSDEEFEKSNEDLNNFTYGEIKSIKINAATYIIRDILIENDTPPSKPKYGITGDTHGDLDFKILYEAIRRGYTDIFVCGDWGYLWDGSILEQKRLDYIESNIGLNIYFVCGNHENFNLLHGYPIVEFNGAKAHKIRDNIYHLMRGEIFTFGNKKILAFGGAHSTDKHLRKENISWWYQEVPTDEEKSNAINNLAKYDNKVDYIITHTGHTEILEDMKGNYRIDDISEFLSELYKTIDFKWWYHGHMHINHTYIEGKTTCISKEIIKIDV